MTDFNNIPRNWALCPGNGCPRAADCLRHLAYCQAPAGVSEWVCVIHHANNAGDNANAAGDDTADNTGDGGCRYFHTAEKKRMAYGMNRIFQGIRNRHVRHALRVKISDYLGSIYTYGLYKKGLRGLNPEQQQWISDLISQNGGTAETIFDGYFEEYDFQTPQQK